MIEFYLPIKTLHVIAVLCSGSLFFIRGLMVLSNRQAAMAAPVRYLKRGRDKKIRLCCFIAAVSIYLFMFSVARSHHPLGILHALAN